MLPGYKLEQILDHNAIIADKNGGKRALAADHVVLSLGVRSENRLAKELEERGVKVYTVGDAETPGRIVHAVTGAFMTARNLK